MKRSRILAIVITSGLTLSFGLVACGGEDSADTATSTSVDQSAADSGTDFAAEIEKRGKPEMKPVEETSKLVVTDDVEGTGKTVAAGDTVTVQYVGAAAPTAEVFDNSWDRGEAATFPLDGVIQGWTEGLVGMKEGGRRTLVIPGDLAYGPNPPPGSGIEPNATLVFTIDLEAVA